MFLSNHVLYRAVPFCAVAASKPLPFGIASLLREILCLLFPLILVSSASAHTSYYVAPYGNDLNAGTKVSPWRTLQKAANTMHAGDTALVANGKYLEVVTSTAAGSVGAPITFQALSANAVVSGFSINHSYHIIKGFTLTGAGVVPFSGTVMAQSGANSLVVANNCFDGSPANVYQVSTAASSGLTNLTVNGNQFLNGNFHAIKIYGNYNTISSNLFTSPNGWDAINIFSSNSSIRGNNFINWSNVAGNLNHPDLIQSFDVNGEVAVRVIIEGNFAYNCLSTQIGNIQDTHTGNNVADWTWRNNIFSGVEWAMSLNARSMKFYNNVFYHCGNNISAVILFRNVPGRFAANDGQMINNLFIACGDKPNVPTSGWYSVDAGVTGFSADYNLVVGTGAGTIKNTFKVESFELHGINGLDPQFVNPSLMNFRLRPTSPAVGSGQNLSAFFTTDFTGGKRVGPWSRGAY